MGEVRSGSIFKADYISTFLPVILFILYSIGYSYLKYYYLGVGINFEYYISLTDIIFYTIEYLIKTFFMYLVFEGFSGLLYYILEFFVFKDLVFYVKKRIFNQRYLDLFLKMNRLKIYIAFQEILILFIITVVGFNLVSAASGGAILSEYLIYITPFLVGKVIFLLNKDVIKRKSLLVLIVVIGIYFSGLFVLSNLGSIHAKNIEQADRKFTLSFKLGDVEYSTNGESSNFIYLGETSVYFFLFDKVNKETLAFRKDNIELIRVFKSKETKLSNFEYRIWP